MLDDVTHNVQDMRLRAAEVKRHQGENGRLTSYSENGERFAVPREQCRVNMEKAMILISSTKGILEAPNPFFSP